MIISAEAALQAIQAGEATVDGFTRDDAGNRLAIVTNHERCDVNHVECDNRRDETPAEKEIARRAKAASDN